MLWNGDIKGIYDAIKQTIVGKKKTEAVKKWKNYFEKK